MTLFPGTMVPIYTTTVGAGGQSAIEFNNIPQTYTDLVVKLSVRTTRSGTHEGGIGIGINGNTSTGYSWKTIEVQGTNVVSSSTPYEPDWVSRIPATSTTSGIFSNTEIYIPNYTSSNPKSYFADGVAPNNSGTATLTLLTGIQSSTSPITSLLIRDKSNTLLPQYSTATLYGISNALISSKATGGVIYEDNTYWYHAFINSGTFTPNQNLTCDCLVIGGGGGGGRGVNTVNYGSGGAAGVLRYSSSQSLISNTAYTITIGAGGNGSVPPSGSAGNGSTTSMSGSGFSTITATGGGGAGSGRTGGSNADYSGGTGSGGTNSGGGAGNSGNGSLGNGGTGSSSYASWISPINLGTNGIIGGGGGGTNDNGGSSGTVNGGGGPFDQSNNIFSRLGRASTGGGGGGTQIGDIGGHGGSGIVIIRYAK